MLDFAPELLPGFASFDQGQQRRLNCEKRENQHRLAQKHCQGGVSIHRIDNASNFANEFHPVVFLVVRRDDRAEVLPTPSPTPQAIPAAILNHRPSAVLWRGADAECRFGEAAQGADNTHRVLALFAHDQRKERENQCRLAQHDRQSWIAIHRFDNVSNFTNEFHPVVFLHVGRDDRAEVLPTPSPTPQATPAVLCASSEARHAGPGGPTPGGKPTARQTRALVDDPSTSGPEFLLACAWLYHHGSAADRQKTLSVLGLTPWERAADEPDD